MKRVKALVMIVSLVMSMVSLSTVASSIQVGSANRFYGFCPSCGEIASIYFIEYRQPSSSSSGFVKVHCNTCSQDFSRVTKYWGVDYDVKYSNLGLFDIVLFTFSGEAELGFVNQHILPTCTKSGQFCFRKVSDPTYGLTSGILPLSHSYLETNRTPATCLPGSVEYMCSRCSQTKTESLPADSNAHTWTETSRTPISCVPGTINYTCSVCSQTKTEPLPADLNAHTWTETSRTPATCLPGSIEYTCSTCHDTKTESIPALENAHTYEIEEIVPAEYDSDGNLLTASYIHYACSDCGDSYNSTIGGNISGPIINEGEGGTGMGDATAALGKTFLSGLWALFGIYVPGFSFTFGQMWLGVLLASVSILVVRMMFGFGGSGPGGVSSRTGSTNNPKISKERRHDEF